MPYYQWIAYPQADFTMTASFKQYRWTDKTTIKRHLVFGIIIALLLIVSYHKLKPYFTKQYKIIIVSRLDSNPKMSSKEQSDLARTGLDSMKANHTESPSHRSTSFLHTGGGSRVLERPPFDNTTVTLSAVLVNGVTTAQTESGLLGVEARIIDLVPDADHPSDMADISVRGAMLSGEAAPQFQLKKMNLQFTELVTQEGKHFSIAGVGIDPENKGIGISASYSSGMASRLLGVTIEHALQTADHVASTRVLENTNDSDLLHRELTRQSIESTNQPVSEMTQEATKDLRETHAVLSLAAGTPLLVRLKATVHGGPHQ